MCIAPVVGLMAAACARGLSYLERAKHAVSLLVWTRTPESSSRPRPWPQIESPMSAAQICCSDSTFYLEKELKSCDHYCFPSTTPKCCHCSDIRPHLEGNTYPVYVDGVGWLDEGSRDEGYCPVCNPKNYSAWEKKIEQTRKEKAQKAAARKVLLEKESAEAVDDSVRVENEIGNTKGTFNYTNGDVYEGEFLNGERHGSGVMTYSEDGSVYEGQWAHGKQCGQGTKTWVDGISYAGEWRDDKMHGVGRYVLFDGSVMEGRFEDDEFVE